MSYISFPKYHKIQSVFKRDLNKNNKPLILGDYAVPEFEMLKDCDWVFTEKVDGTNIRIFWDGSNYHIGGRKDKSQIPVELSEHLVNLFNQDSLRQEFGSTQVVIFGEGYGGKINSGAYDVEESFVCFDIFINGYWLNREDVANICNRLGISYVPLYAIRSLDTMIKDIQEGKIFSSFRDSFPEGVVGTPYCGLLARNYARIITKLKYSDLFSPVLKEVSHV